MTRKHNYLVGYVGENQIAYGKNMEFVELLTAHQARSHLKQLFSDHPKTIYKLVPVKLIKGK